MQFKVITSVLLFFVAQTVTMATPNPQPAVIHCTLPFIVLALKVELITSFADTLGFKGIVS